MCPWARLSKTMEEQLMSLTCKVRLVIHLNINTGDMENSKYFIFDQISVRMLGGFLVV